MKKLLLFIICCTSITLVTAQQNVGIGTNNPQSKLDVNGGLSIGSSYAGTTAAPANGAIIEGSLGVGTPTPSSSAVVDVNSTSKGMLVPRMTTAQRNAIASPANGLLIYNTSTNQFNYFDGTVWQAAVGPQGLAGTAGAAGAQGPTGATGSQGAQGIQGPAGPAGAAGAQGPTGATGSQGAQGIQGPAGAAGAQGPTGAQGVQGVQGIQGIQGTQGPAGAQGAAGPTGATGLLSAGTAAGNTTYWNGSTWVLNSSNIYNNGGNVGIGMTSAPTYKLQVSADGAADIAMDRASANASGNNLYSFKSRGTRAAPEALLSGDDMLLVRAYGYDGASDIEAARITIDAEAAPATGNVPGRMLFYTRAASNGTLAERMRLTSNGDVGIGVTTPTAKLEVAGDFEVSGVDSKVKFVTKEANNGWTLIYIDDFESSTDGWSMYTSATSSTASTTYFDRESFGVIGLSTNLNNYGKTSNAYVFKKLFDMSGVTWTEAMITFDYLYIDSWDGRERGYAGVQATLTGNPCILWNENYDNNDDLNGRMNYSWTGTNSGYNDSVKKATLNVRNNVITGGNFYLIIGATLDDTTTDESFGIDNVEVWVR